MYQVLLAYQWILRSFILTHGQDAKPDASGAQDPFSSCTNKSFIGCALQAMTPGPL